MSLCEHGNKRPCFACEYDGEPAGAYKYDDLIGNLPLKYIRDNVDYELQSKWFREIDRYTKVTGSDNPFYDFSEPVSNMRELIRVLDPHMPHYRFNLLKSAIRWNNKPNLRYNLEKARDAIDEALLQMSEDEESG